MSARSAIAGLVRRAFKSDELIIGLDRQSQLINQKSAELIAGQHNQSQLINEKSAQVGQRLDAQSELVDGRLTSIASALGELSTQTDRRAGDLSNGLDRQNEFMTHKFAEAMECIQPKPQEQWRFNLLFASLLAGSAQQPANAASWGAPRRVPRHINLDAYAGVFSGIAPWSGYVPKAFSVDFLGGMLDLAFQPMRASDPAAAGDQAVSTTIPTLAEAGDAWFEMVDWVEAARAARNSFSMVTLGAAYGAQAVGAFKALQAVNPLPYKLVAVEPDPVNCGWIARHFANNGIDPHEHWIAQATIGATNDPVFFPVGFPGAGSQSVVTTNDPTARQLYLNEIEREKLASEVLRSLILNRTTGIQRRLDTGQAAEIKLVSALTLNDILNQFEVVDLLESDIQQSEIEVFPAGMGLLQRKVKRIHIGTHGADIHFALLDLFKNHGWEIVFDFEPDSEHHTSMGSFKTGDGVLTVKNPLIA